MNENESLYCANCKTQTPHAKTESGREYVCGLCGESQEVITTQITASRRFVYTHNGGLNPQYVYVFGD